MRKIVSTFQVAPLTWIVSCLTVVIGFSTELSESCEIQFHSAFTTLQLLTCHLTHWSTEHLMWDVAMFIGLGVLCERDAPRAFYATVLTSALSIPLAVMLSHPEIAVYRGLSGVDTAIFALFASKSLIDGAFQKDRVSVPVFGAMLALLWLKISFEFCSGTVLFVQQLNFVPLPMAHAVGAMLGMFLAPFSSQRHRWARRILLKTKLSSSLVEG